MSKKELKILIVEDDENLRESMATMLGMLFPGKVLTAEDGQRALRLIKDHYNNVRIVITDINMPGGMDGITMLEKLRDEHNDSLKIVISGYLKNFENERLSVICNHIFEKPVDLKTITNIISSYLL